MKLCHARKAEPLEFIQPCSQQNADFSDGWRIQNVQLMEFM